jgi:glutamyl-tRNA reductase
MSDGILVVGLNHATAPVHIRERITFPGDEDGHVTRAFREIAEVQEAMILSTCNRAEIIAASDRPVDASELVVERIATIHGVETEPLRAYLYVKTGKEAVQHVFRVAASLDSMVVGEPQILGQVKGGYRRAAEANATGPILNRLLHRAFFTAKRVRNETGVGAAAVSVAYVAVELAGKILGELADKSVLLIGAGEMAELAARHLAGKVEKPIHVTNRTFENACSRARKLEGRPLPMDNLEGGLVDADVVITSTGSCEPIITAAGIRTVMKRRRYRPVFLIDIAIPRDVEPQVNDIDGVYLYNIDDLQAVAEENMGERRHEAMRGESIVLEEVDKFMDWATGLDFAPTIVAMRDKFEKIRSGELERCNGKLSGLTPDQRRTVELITRGIINKIAHDPITFLKKTGTESKRNLRLDLAQKMFKLDGLALDANLEEDEFPDT